MEISTLYKGVAPYKNVVANDLVLDKEGKKMSKSKGNTLDPFEMFDKYGADAVRYYSMYVSPAWIPTRFDEAGLKEVDAKLFRTYRNIYSFFQLYSNTDNIDPREFFVEYKDRSEIDKWILSKYNSLIKYYDEQMEIFEYTNVVRAIQEFIVEDFSNWYIRRTRRRFWQAEINTDKKAVYNTTYEILVGVTKLLAPFTPYITEEIYQKLVGDTSVHLTYLPKLNENLIDQEVEEQMDLARRIVTLGRASREDASIKVRQPLSRILIDNKFKEMLTGVIDLLKEELNIKDVVFNEDLSKYMQYELRPNFKIAGSILGKKIGALGKELKNVNPKEFIEKLENGTVMLNLLGEETEIEKDFVEIRISSKEGFDITMDKNLFVILDTELSTELIDEGYMREFISKIQQMRKTNDFEVTDEIEIYFESDDELFDSLNKFSEEIKKETLSTKLERKELDTKEIELNDKFVKIKLERM